MRATRLRAAQIALLFPLLVCSASMGLYWNRLPGAVQAAQADTVGAKPKPLTDLYPRWYGTRELLLHHRDPYGNEVSREIQIAYYGRALDPSLPSDQIDQKRFAYPGYVIFLMAPTVFMEFRTVQVVFWWFLATVTACSVWLWLRFLRLHLPGAALIAVFAVTLSSLPILQGMSLLQLGLVVAGLIAAAAFCVASGRLFLAGALLAMATIKPQMSVLVIAWFALWALAGWSKRKTLGWGFGTTLVALVLSSEYLLPGWLLRYPSALLAYSRYQYAPSFLGMVLPSALCRVASVVAVLGVGWLCWRVRKEPVNSAWFAIASACVLTLTVTVVPTVNALFNHVLVLPAFLLGIRHWKDLGRGNRLSRAALYAVCGCGFLPWVLALAVLTVQPDLRSGWYSKMWPAPLYSSLALPIATLGFLSLLCKTVASKSQLEGTRLAAVSAVQEQPDVGSAER